MTKKIPFQDSFLVSGIMCFQGCGATIQRGLDNCLGKYKKEGLVSANAQLVMDAEPQALGIHRLFITITTEGQEFNQNDRFKEQVSARFKKSVDSLGFEVINNYEEEKKEGYSVNWVNIVTNLLTIAAISTLGLLFSPSILLTFGLTALSFLTTAFTARHYLRNFFRNPGDTNVLNMNTTVTLGWFLSLAHTLYHAISMPFLSGFSMMFMCFIMPVVLIAIINGMDEIKRKILNQSKKMHLHGIKMLFPQMAEEYPCYQLSTAESFLSQPIDLILGNDKDFDAFFNCIEDIVVADKLVMERKNSLKEGMLIKINHGDCFPVDCILINGQTIVDSSLLTGEAQQSKRRLDFIPAGAINLSEPVVVYASKDPYHSTVNQLLFRSNRAKENIIAKPNHNFTYLYTALIAVGIAAAIIAPWALGILTFSLSLQNITGILFAICPCTIAIAHQLPSLLNLYQRSNQGITVRDENICSQNVEIHTVVFDKTGTLTTGNSQVESSEGISASLWARIYLLEKHQGAAHPLAKAITRYYESKTSQSSIIQDIDKVSKDRNSRGLSALVQGRELHIGSADYLRQFNIHVPELDSHKTEQGFTPVYVAEDKKYKGAIYIKHEIRKDVLAALTRLKNAGTKIIMLTGDSESSALGFNQQNGSIFALEDIHAEQTPQHKETFLSSLMNTNNADPKGVWFIGDGLNDAPCAKTVSEKGGISCAMTADDKTSFFTDISLNGSLDYLFAHNKLNQFLKKNILQNQGLLMYSALAFTAFIVSFAIAGIAVSPIIPLMIMASTTLMVLFNSYRVQLAIDCVLDKKTSWLKRLLASDASIGLLTGASLQFMCGLLISTIATGGLAFPAVVFTAGTALAISSVCLLSATTLCALFIVLATTYLCFDKYVNIQEENSPLTPSPLGANVAASPEASVAPDNGIIPPPLWSLATPKEGEEESSYSLSAIY